MNTISAAEWKTVILGDVCLIEKSKHNGGPAPYVGLEDIANDTGEFLGSFDPVTMKSATFRFDARHLLYGRLRPYLNKAYTPDFVGHCSSEIFPLRPNEELDRRYLYYWLTSDAICKSIDATSTGARMPRANMNEVMRFEMPLPPMEEQRRIVAILDDAFVGLDRACAHIETNLKDARDLLAVIIDKEFIDVSASAEGLELQNLCTSRGITYGVIKLGDHFPDGIPCLRTSNVRSLAFDLDGMKRIDPSLSQEYSRTILEGGELLVNVRGTLGGVAVVPLSMRGWNVSREVAMVAIDSTHILPEYAAFFVATSKAICWLTGVVTGATYKGINLADLRKLVVPCPSLDEQKKLVRRLSVALDTNRNLVRRNNDKLTDLEDLRQSLLQRAFAGELT